MDGYITGYHPYDTGDSDESSPNCNQISNYSYNNGVHSITFYSTSEWVNGTYSGRIQFRYLDGESIFHNLNAFDLVNCISGVLLKNTTSDRYFMYNTWGGTINLHANYSICLKYNAYKHLLSETSYWYVLDGIQFEWTDNLSSIGYNEIPKVNLPEVVLFGSIERDYWLYVGATISISKTLSSGSNCPLYSEPGSSSYGWTTYPKAIISCQVYKNSDYSNVNKGRTGLSLVMSQLSGYDWPGCKNESDSDITFTRVKAAYCRNNSVIVVQVYNSSSSIYNAFRFTDNNIDYYYVLDGVQKNWVIDLDSIGYSLNPVIKRAYCYANLSYYGNNYSGLTYTAAGGDYIPVNNSKQYVVVSIYSSPEFDPSTITIYNGSSPARLYAKCYSPFSGALWYVDYYEVDV